MSDQDNFYTVQKILARKRTKQGSFCYKIKWKNWPISTSTWQPAEHLQYVKDMVNKYDRFCDMRRGKKRVSRQRKQVERSDEDKFQQKLKKNKGIVGGKKTTNESQINQNQQDNEKNINNGKQSSPIFLIVKHCRNIGIALQNQTTKNSNTILDPVLSKQNLKRTINRGRINKVKIGRINHMKAVNQMRREKKRRQLQKRELKNEEKRNKENIQTKNKTKRIKKMKKIQKSPKQNYSNENQVKIKRKYIRRLKINIDNRSRRRQKPTIENPNEEKKIQSQQNQQNKTQKKREKKYDRPGRPRKILSQEQLQLRKEKIRLSRKLSKPGRPNVVLSQEEKEKRREMRRLKLRKYDRRGRPKKIQTQQQIERKRQALKQRRKIRRKQKEAIALDGEKLQNPIIIPMARRKRSLFSNKKENYSDVVKKQENEADIIKLRQIEQWNSGQNIGFTESNQQLQKLRAINEQSNILVQQSQPYRIPIYTPIQAFNIKQGLDLGQQSYPKLQPTKRNYRRRNININKFKRRQNPKRRKQRSFANLFSYERSKDLNQIPKQVYEQKSIQKVELKSKEAVVSKDSDSLIQIMQNQSLRDQLFNYNPENFSNKTIYEDNKILVQFRNEHDQKCAIEVGELAKYCGEWLKYYYQSYI